MAIVSSITNHSPLPNDKGEERLVGSTLLKEEIKLSRRIAETVSHLIEKNGGSLFVNAGIKKIKIHKGRAIGVEMENGDLVRSSSIISSAGVSSCNGFIRSW